MKVNRIIFFIIFFIVFINHSLFSQTSSLWGSLTKGSYEVGFRVINLVDSNRTIANSQYRPIQVSLWYPAHGSSSGKMKYSDYIRLEASEKEFNQADSVENETVENFIQKITARGIDKSAVEQWTTLPMEAVYNAEIVNKRFPLILIGQGNFHAAHNLSILSEFLASHGFIVASSPSQSRLTGPPQDSTEVLGQAIDNKNDLKFILDQLNNGDVISSKKIGLIGYSFGGRGAFLLLNELEEIDAFVSLDGGFANKIGKHWIDNAAINSNLINSPILHIYQDVESYVVPDFTLVESLTNSTRYLVKIDQMRHAFFYNVGMAVGTIEGFTVPGAEPYDVREKTESVYKITLAFLNYYLHDTGDWNSEIEEIQNNKSFIEVNKLAKE